MKPLKLVLTPTRNRRLNELIGFLLLVAACLLFLALVSYHPTDPSFDTVGGYAAGRPSHNWIGMTGAWIADLLLQAEGLSAFTLPLLMGGLGWLWMRSRPAGSPGSKLIGAVLCLLFGPALFGLLPGHLHVLHGIPVEGLTGRLMADALVHYLNFPGACIVTITMVAAAIYLSTTFSLNTAREWAAVRFAFVVAWRDRWRNWKQARGRRQELKQAERLDKLQEKELKQARKAAEKAAKAGKAVPAAVAEADEDNVPGHRQGAFAEMFGEAPAQQSVWEQIPRAKIPDPEPQAEPVAAQPALKPQLVKREEAPAPPKKEPQSAPQSTSQGISIGERADTETRSVTVTPKSVSGFRLPPSTLLHRSDDPQVVREDVLRTEAQVLVEKCAEFDVLGQVVQINPGPVVTTFEFRPEAGVKYSRVTGLADDLCLAMRAESILIERMAGKSTVGIQVPNHNRETIWLRDVVESENFSTTKNKLTLALGKDINGRIVTTDLATMPHVLIAGSTGSGKSVAINAMIMSVLYKATPEQVRMILVDPKRVELGMYEGIPHLFTPIITEPKLAANALRNAVREMERRLKLLASRSVRNIDQYNKLFEGTPSLFEDAEVEEKPLPYIVIIIDELADLMMLDKANVEEAITRLAQMARAVGIHLVLATQRPSVDVITGLIKANVPTRISFRLATKVDSRTILDSNGAEALLGRGDMLFLPPGTSRLQRVHAPFVTEKEIAAVTDFWKKQGEAEYVQGFLESPKDERGRDLDAGGAGQDENDELFEDAVRLVLEFGKASTSLLQRRLRIGYGRAAHLIDLMERDGIVGPAEGSKPREILKPPDWLNEVESAIR
ncbi:DNA translocase FtsK [Paracidobacterium acidisoli]|uniref:DNA translocase FtsK n=1 Tax=Paracidobacterium acidisoli TaxID=2303751 RepID=A0A372IRC8_9BACT|nr:DNA translocase FtsK [Paracidobacterium acidisoli]MBT9331439.1 DNA translocase FtsK [Paracidobacterium acidisoli]